MKNESRIVELLAEMVQKHDQMISKQDKVVAELQNVKLEIVKLNLQSAENTRSLLTLSEKMVQIVEHEKRISKLESIVLK